MTVTISDHQVGLHQTRVNCRDGHWDGCHVLAVSGPNVLLERVEGGDTASQRLVDDPEFLAEFRAALARLDGVVARHFARLKEF